MANKTVEYIIKVRDLGSAALRKFAAELQSVSRVASSAASAMGSAIVGAGKYAAAGITAAFAGIALTIREAFKVETALAQFEVLLGSAEKAKQVFSDLKKFSDATPFEFKEVAQAGRMLLAFGEDSATLMKTLTTLGDIAAAVGMPFAELAEIYGKNRVQGRLMAQDVNQLTGRGIPVIGEFAKILGVSQEEVRGMVESGAVGFPILEKALQNLTAPGAKFAGMMDKLSTTGEGLFSTLLGEWSGALADFGKELMGLAKEGITAAIDGVKRLRDDGTITAWAKTANEALTLVKNTLMSIFSGDTKTLSLSFDVLKAAVSDAFQLAIDMLMKAAPVIGELIGRAAKSLIDGTRGGVMSTVRDQMANEGLITKGPLGLPGGLGPEAKRRGLSKADIRQMMNERTDAGVKALLAESGVESKASSLPAALAALKARVEGQSVLSLTDEERATLKPKPQAAPAARTRSRQELEDARRAAQARFADANRALSINPSTDPQVLATFEQLKREASAEIVETSIALAAMMKQVVPTKEAKAAAAKVEKEAAKASGRGFQDGGGFVASDSPLPGRSGFESMMEDLQGSFSGSSMAQGDNARRFRARLGGSFASRLMPSQFDKPSHKGESTTASEQLSELQKINQTLNARLGMKP